MDIAPRSRGAIFMIVNITSVHLRVLYVSAAILRQVQDDNHGDTEYIEEHGGFEWSTREISSVYLRALYASVVILRQVQDDNRQAQNDNHGDTECTQEHGDFLEIRRKDDFYFSNESERISNGKTVHKIIFSPMSIAQFYLIDDPWILQPWLTQREAHIQANHKHRYIKPKTKTGING